MKVLSHSKIYTGVCLALWSAAILALPFSSFPLLAKMEIARTVAPLSLIFWGILGVFWMPVFWVRDGKMPGESIPLLWFTWVVGVSWGASFFIEAPTFRSLTPLNQSPEAVSSFILGIGVYLFSTAWLSNDRSALNKTLRLLYIGGSVMLIWSMIQVYYIFAMDSNYPSLVYQIQRAVSSSGSSLFQGRATGFAYEPSWVAHQLNIIYLPFWLAASISRQSVFRKLGPVSVENILLLFGSIVLLATFSRVGWLSFGMVLITVVAAGLASLIRRFTHYCLKDYQGPYRRIVGILLGIVIIILSTVVIIFLASIAIRIAFRFEPRLERIIELNPLKATSFYDFANRLIIGERVIYWSAGWEIFNQYPFLGVGIGNAGLYFPQKMSAFGWWLTEVKDLIFRLPFSMNIKSFWMRLLAEVGIAGFIFFLSWYLVLIRAGLTARRSPDPLLKMLGLGGLFMLIGFLAEGFSVDSFALPYVWFSAALLSAGILWARREYNEAKL